MYVPDLACFKLGIGLGIAVLASRISQVDVRRACYNCLRPLLVLVLAVKSMLLTKSWLCHLEARESVIILSFDPTFVLHSY